MTTEDKNARQIFFDGDKIPSCKNIITVVYASNKDIYLYDGDGLDDAEKAELVRCLIVDVQWGTAYSRDIVKRIGDVFFIY